jgi:hypothetical protein
VVLSLFNPYASVDDALSSLRSRSRERERIFYINSRIVVGDGEKWYVGFFSLPRYEREGIKNLDGIFELFLNPAYITAKPISGLHDGRNARRVAVSRA